jgi:type I restriction enzyme M protein
MLFRGSAEGRGRLGLLQADLFEAVIGLAPNLFYGTGIPASILVLNRDKAAERRGEVLFHRRVRRVRGGEQPEPPAQPRHRAHRRHLPRLRGRG